MLTLALNPELSLGVSFYLNMHVSMYVCIGRQHYSSNPRC